MFNEQELAVTLSTELYDHLRDEAQRLEIPLEWLVASLIVDTLDVPCESVRPSRRSRRLEPALAG